jgi:hypothetical protein
MSPLFEMNIVETNSILKILEQWTSLIKDNGAIYDYNVVSDHINVSEPFECDFDVSSDAVDCSSTELYVDINFIPIQPVQYINIPITIKYDDKENG